MVGINQKKSLLAAAIGLAISFSSGVYAQETTSGIAGLVSSESGQALANTRVTIIHLPTNTKTEVSTNANGRFSTRGLKAGGPYKVVIDSDTHQDAEQADIYLRIGETLKIAPQLRGMGEMEEVVVTADALALERNSGTGSVFGLGTLENSASFNRDLKDIARMNPLVNIRPGADSEMSVAGSNPRFNSLTVDGVSQNDDFGLNSNGYPTHRSPISMESIEQIAVDIAPIDLRSTGFTGGRINAVTKSGTNEFHGSIFYEESSDSWAGGVNPDTGRDIGFDFEEKTFGGSIGGPIIPDKLFFFASYEEYDSPESRTWGPAGSNSPNQSNITQAQYDAVREIAKRVYGFDLAGRSAAIENHDEKSLVKLDWNISDDHRLSYTYQLTEGTKTRAYGDASYRLSDDSYLFDENLNLESHSVGIWSDWSDNFSTELRIATKTTEKLSTPFDTSIGQVTVEIGRDSVVFGGERYRHANKLVT
ncbi:MAG: carboxypeptidase regulatory-like domain-containing protein, partial [Cellvibrionaceae bacterium]|nr:carboxypeptidase regulatory-like domain-containing protein [Cellvibrionaceae bacterium]